MKSNIAIVGEAWGIEEAQARVPFIGSMSRQLNPMLEEAGIHPADVYKTNVFNLRYDGKVEIFCGDKSQSLPGYGPLSKQGKYCRAEFKPELDRLADELAEVNPNLIIPMGGTALWSFTGKTGITKQRGTTSLSTHTISGFKILPTYHPAAIIHQWELRPTTVLDLMKAKREAAFPEIRRPQADIHIPETIEDLYAFREGFIHRGTRISVDIETSGDQITTIGFAPSPRVGIVIPFLDTRRKSHSFWPSESLEQAAWKFVRELCEDGGIKKVFQNGLYDIAFLWRAYGIKVIGAEEDTMLLHHALQPEALKGLGYLGSIYTDHGPWKHMREKKTTIKQED